MLTSFSRGKGAALAFALAAAILATPAIGATDLTDIGSIDQNALAALPQFQAANRQLADYGNSLQKQFSAHAAHASQADQQKLYGQLQAEMADKQRAVLGPLFQRAQVAIASVASSHNLSVVVDKRIVVYGGQDITGPVRDLLTGVGDPVPPVSTPKPSSIGYVDQQAIDQTPKVKAATDDFMKFKNDQDAATRDKLKSAKTDADRDAILTAYRKTLDDRQNTTLKPAVDATRDAISAVAKSKGLVLVIDRGNIIYGGTDITTDVTAKLK
ncbi:MAG TPA: OmpH family outer membrane protein [Candidatus Limnocylindria bacterium]|jgi:outer membrane protein|nr:OmpH family outer membrane protein [Candidatus Limnocylindria bacterium]